MSNNIQDKIIVITGASSGMGEAAARHLAQQGAKVVRCDPARGGSGLRAFY